MFSFLLEAIDLGDFGELKGQISVTWTLTQWRNLGFYPSSKLLYLY